MIQRNVMDSETELLQRIEKAISRMDDSPYRDNLIAKYWAISNGAKYQLTNVAPLLIGLFDWLLPSSMRVAKLSLCNQL